MLGMQKADVLSLIPHVPPGVTVLLPALNCAKLPPTVTAKQNPQMVKLSSAFIFFFKSILFQKILVLKNLILN